MYFFFFLIKHVSFFFEITRQFFFFFWENPNKIFLVWFRPMKNTISKESKIPSPSFRRRFSLPAAPSSSHSLSYWVNQMTIETFPNPWVFLHSSIYPFLCSIFSSQNCLSRYKIFIQSIGYWEKTKEFDFVHWKW